MQDLYGAAGYFSEVKGSLKRKRTCVSPLTPLNYYLNNSQSNLVWILKESIVQLLFLDMLLRHFFVCIFNHSLVA